MVKIGLSLTFFHPDLVFILDCAFRDTYTYKYIFFIVCLCAAHGFQLCYSWLNVCTACVFFGEATHFFSFDCHWPAIGEQEMARFIAAVVFVLFSTFLSCRPPL